jgi:hypothetical protein
MQWTTVKPTMCNAPKTDACTVEIASLNNQTFSYAMNNSKTNDVQRTQNLCFRLFLLL